MKLYKLLGLIALLGLLIACTLGVEGLPKPVDPANPWQVVLELDPDHTFALAAFFDETSAITAGAQGVSRYSVDGGQTWTLGEGLSTNCRFGIDMVDGAIAWTTGHRGLVQITTDGGQSWQTVSDLDNDRLPAQISFLDARTGWVGSSNQLWATDDGGQTWTELALPAVAGSVIANALRTADDGYLLDAEGTLHVTNDGGESWTSHSLGLEDEILASPTVQTAAMRFFDESNGVLILNLEGEPGLTALRTSDGGQSWMQESVPVDPGVVHLTHDGALLTVVAGVRGDLVVVRY